MYASNIRDQVNETLFVYCMSYVLLKKLEFRTILPSFAEIMPADFIQYSVLREGKYKVTRGKKLAKKPAKIIMKSDIHITGRDINPENRVAYWREDYGINSHHWHWHLIHPSEMGGANEDRKGELFYYMHQQMLARYDMERLCNGLTRVEPLSNLRAPIRDGYYSKLVDGNSGKSWGTRQDGTILSDFTRKGPYEQFTISSMELQMQRLLDGIHKGYLLNTSGGTVPISDDVDIKSGAKRGIDILGDVIEADGDLSVNLNYYGSLHNYGHLLLAACHDPTGAHREQLGVMGATETAMRDPVFYRWHRHVDNIFQTYKNMQTPYATQQLVLDGITVDKIGLRTGEKDDNILKTICSTKRIEASRGLDFRAAIPVEVKLTILNHEPFTYTFLIQNSKPLPFEVTVRVFLAPKLDESGEPMSFLDQKMFWAEMDKFKYELEPGQNCISRKSEKSSITTTDEISFIEIESKDGRNRDEEYCGCGWPEHMLVPRGKVHGMAFQLFVILTDYSIDKINDKAPSKDKCGKSVSYCGLLDEVYPDSRAMGFPLDRMADVNTMQDFVDGIPNSRLEEIEIRFDPKPAACDEDE